MDYQGTVELDGIKMPVTVRGENAQEAKQLVLEAIAEDLDCETKEIDQTSVVVTLTRKGK